MKDVHLKNCKKVNCKLQVEIGAVLKGTYVIEVPVAPVPWVIVASLLKVCEICIG